VLSDPAFPGTDIPSPLAAYHLGWLAGQDHLGPARAWVGTCAPSRRSGGLRDCSPVHDLGEKSQVSSSVRLDVIPFSADRSPVFPVEMFFMHDEVQVNVELISGWQRVTKPGEIAMYAEAFTRLSGIAVYGSQARALVHQALHALG
jgi:hypothetical protein